MLKTDGEDSGLNMMYGHVDANELRHMHVLKWFCNVEIAGEHTNLFPFHYVSVCDHPKHSL